MNTASSTKTAAKRVAKKASAETPAPVAAPAPAPVAVAPAAEKKVARKSAAKTEAAPAPAPVAVPAVAAPVVADAVEAPQQTVGDEIKGMITSLNGLREVISTLHTQVKKLEKRVHREIKDARKRKRRVKAEGDASAAPAKPSIFQRPVKVTDELCVFLGKPKGSEMSRSNVTKAVTTYIKEKGLKNKHDIKPDAALKNLLQVPDADHLTYFNLQRYLNAHYVKEAKPTSA